MISMALVIYGLYCILFSGQFTLGIVMLLSSTLLELWVAGWHKK